MVQINSRPFRFKAIGCSDSRDSTEAFPGAMLQLSNLVPDPSTSNQWVCRPAEFALCVLSGASYGGGTPGFVSAMRVVGDYLYGMVAMSGGSFNGLDAPFAVNLMTGAQVIPSGVVPSNCPASVAATGAWTPPSMDTVSTNVIVCHPGFPVAGGKVGYFNISSPGAPTWNVTNMATNDFPVAPIAVKNFNGRAYYICNTPGTTPALVFSDVLAPFTRTNASQALTFQDSVPLTALGTLQFLNQLGGIVQALIVFKGDYNLFQVTGDAAGNTLAQNAMNVATGTLSPLTLVNSPQGMLFLSPDGFRLIDQNAKVSEPIGRDGKGITVPFIYAVTPSRVSAVCNAEYLRVSTQNGNAPTSPPQEWIYDLGRNAWCGPHTFPFSLAQAYKNTFITTPLSVPGQIWQSDIYQNVNTSFMENGVQMNFMYQTCLIPDEEEDMYQYTVNECYVSVAMDAFGNDMTAVAQDEKGAALNNTTIPNSTAGSLWGSMVWGVGTWGGTPSFLARRAINWNLPLVFSQASFTIQGKSGMGVTFGSLKVNVEHMRYIKQP